MSLVVSLVVRLCVRLGVRLGVRCTSYARYDGQKARWGDSWFLCLVLPKDGDGDGDEIFSERNA